ncbi:MAG: class I SAM-dependent methyltransferase [Gammaproteobacteria bacterium]
MNSLTRDIRLGRATRRLGWTARVTRNRLLQRLAALPAGRLTIEDADGSHEIGGAAARPELHARVEVHDEGFYHALAGSGSVGAAESWVRGEWSSPDVVQLTRLMAANVDLLNHLDDNGSVLERIALRALHTMNRNSRTGSRRNIEAHYDLGNEMFEQFLDPTMMYSSAIFPGSSASLEEASLGKLARVCEKLELGPDDHLLEIGTGWGGMAEYAARHHGCRVTTTTISREQHDYAVARIARAGLSDRVTVLLSDYRDLRGQYDKLVSIEMIEAVGHRFLPRYFEACSRLLKSHGLMLLQSITIPDQRYDRARKSVDFIQRYIFPGGFLPSNGQILRQVGERTDMHLVDLLDITQHYARTLAAWRERFARNATRIRELGYGEDFVRLWDFYFAYCEGGFRERAIGTAQFLFAKPGWRPA